MNTHISYFSVALATFVFDAEFGNSIECVSVCTMYVYVEMKIWTEWEWERRRERVSGEVEVEENEVHSTDAEKTIGCAVRSVLHLYVYMRCDGQRKWDGFTFNRQKICIYATNVCTIVCIEQQLKRNWATKNKWGGLRIGVCEWVSECVQARVAIFMQSRLVGGSVAIIVVVMCSRGPAVIYAYVYDIWYSMFALTEMTGQ